MTTPTDAPTPPTPDAELVAGRIGPPVPLTALRDLLAVHGYSGPLEVARHVWRWNRLAPLDPFDEELVGDVTGYALIAAHLTPAGWWAHLMIVGHAGDDSDRVTDEVAALLYSGCPSWRLDPVGHTGRSALDSSWQRTTFLPRVLHLWGPLQRIEALLASTPQQR